GRWNFSETGQQFLGEGSPAISHAQAFPMGVAITDIAMANGMCRVEIRFKSLFGDSMQTGGIVLGYRSQVQRHFFAELRASSSAYSVGEYVTGFGWRPLVTSVQIETWKRIENACCR